MNDKIKQYVYEWRLRRTIVRRLSPTREARKAARLAYLEAARESVGFHTNSFLWMRYTLAGIVGILALNGGAIIYADTADVAVSHPLYNFKRVAENVRLVVAPNEKEVELEARFTERRIKELKAMTPVATATSTTVVATTTSHKENARREKETRLKKDLEERIGNSIESIEKRIISLPKKNHAVRMAAICKELNMVKSDLGVFNDTTSSTRVSAKISAICAESLEELENKDDPTEVSETSDPEDPRKEPTPSPRSTKKKVEVDVEATTIVEAQVKASPTPTQKVEVAVSPSPTPKTTQEILEQINSKIPLI